MSAELAWSDAIVAAQLFAVDPVGLGGILLRSRAGAVRDQWLVLLRGALPTSQPVKHVPLRIADGRLLGGLDLNATLLSGRPVAERGLIAEADDGVLVLAMAERLLPSTSAHLTAAMDARQVVVERDGLSLRTPARFGIVALDEGLEDEYAPAPLRDRLGFYIDLNEISIREAQEIEVEGPMISAARLILPAVKLNKEYVETLCSVAATLGIVSLRAPMLAVRAARVAAALEGQTEVEQDHVALAARLVLAPRALVFPTEQQAQEKPPDPPDHVPDENDSTKADDTPNVDRALEEVILAAVAAALPPAVMAALRASAGSSRARSAGKAGALQRSNVRGRPAGAVRGDLRAGARLNVIETLRAAAPWQALRRSQAMKGGDVLQLSRIRIRKDDFRITRFKQRSETTTIFLVDASGSAALHRLAEAKGAVELLLADCYVRRDQVALIAFRGSVAELLLPPTRSLARAKRSLAGLPGGGGTPLASGLDAAFALADLICRKGQTPTVILLTDGRANIARDGAQGRSRAEEDAMNAARRFRGSGLTAVLVDTSPRPGPSGEALAKEMGARYLPLPHADAATLAKAVLASVF